MRKKPRSKAVGRASKGLGMFSVTGGYREVRNGSFGLKALEAGRVTARQLEAGRKARRRRRDRTGRVWISVFPDRGVTQKSSGLRMGQGKGKVAFHCASVLPGTVLYEVDGVSRTLAVDALGAVRGKLPIQCVVVERASGLRSLVLPAVADSVE